MKANEYQIKELVDSIENKINDIMNKSKYYISNKPKTTVEGNDSFDNFTYNHNLSQHKKNISDNIETIIQTINNKQLKLKNRSISNLHNKTETDNEESENIILTKESDFVILPTVDSSITNKNKNIIENKITIEYTYKSKILNQIQSNIIQISLLGLNKNLKVSPDHKEVTKEIIEFDMEENKIEGINTSQLIHSNKNNLKVFNFDDNHVNLNNCQNTSILESEVIINQIKDSKVIKSKDFTKKLKITKLSDIFYYESTDLKPFTINVSQYIYLHLIIRIQKKVKILLPVVFINYLIINILLVNYQ